MIEHLDNELVTREVIRGWLDTAAEEMQNAIIKSAHSMLIAEGRDATAALFDDRGRTLAQASSIPVHLGVMVGLGRIIAERYPAGVATPGDVYVTNDPYAGGTHMPDIAVCVPIFFEANLVGFALTMAHHRDIGGLLPGSVSLKARDVHAEGLRIPLVRLAKGHVPCDSIWDLITACSRTPRSLRGDLSAQIAGCRTGERRLGELFQRWSPAVVRKAAESLMDYSERLTRQAIATLPRGRATFVDYLDDDGLNPDAAPTRIQASVEVTNDEITFDFTGSDNSVSAAINNVAASTKAIVYYAVRTFTGDSVPSNDGCYRPVQVVLPTGSIVNAEYPAAVGSRGVALKRIEDVVLGALARLAPEKMCAAHSGQYTIVSVAGRDHARGEPLIGHMGGPYAGGNGAQPRRDGIDCSEHGATNGSMISIEDSESRMPLRFRKLELWTDSGGAGSLRGGLGFEAEIEWLGSDIIATLRRERMKFVPRGLQGGEDAPRCRTLLKPFDDSPKELPGKVDFVMRSGDIVHYWTTGGAGRGSPRERERSKVIADVMDGRVSHKAACSIYGLDEKQLVEAQ